MQTVLAALADHSSLSGRRAYSDREEGRPAAIKTEYMNADRGKQRGTSKNSRPPKKDEVAYQPGGSIIVQSVCHAKAAC